MSGDWNGVTTADLRRRIEETYEDLERLVADRRRMRRDIPERDAIAYAYDLMIYAANARLEISALLLAKIETPKAAHVWDRHLIVFLHAALDAYPRLTSRLIREFGRLGSAGPTTVDPERLGRAHRAYKTRAKQITSDREFMEVLNRVRNTAGAHHLTSTTSGIEGLVAWIETQSDPERVPSGRFVENSLNLALAAMLFGRESLASLNWDEFPAVPNEQEYQRRVAELDSQAESSN